MKSPCCDVKMIPYQSPCYPYNSGYKCECCMAEFSHLQISKGALKTYTEPWSFCLNPRKHCKGIK